jgi:aminopeptidase-like protein
MQMPDKYAVKDQYITESSSRKVRYQPKHQATWMNFSKTKHYALILLTERKNSNLGTYGTVPSDY